MKRVAADAEDEEKQPADEDAAETEEGQESVPLKKQPKSDASWKSKPSKKVAAAVKEDEPTAEEEAEEAEAEAKVEEPAAAAPKSKVKADKSSKSSKPIKSTKSSKEEMKEVEAEADEADAAAEPEEPQPSKPAKSKSSKKESKEGSKPKSKSKKEKVTVESGEQEGGAADAEPEAAAAEESSEAEIASEPAAPKEAKSDSKKGSRGALEQVLSKRKGENGVTEWECVWASGEKVREDCTELIQSARIQVPDSRRCAVRPLACAQSWTNLTKLSKKDKKVEQKLHGQTHKQD